MNEEYITLIESVIPATYGPTSQKGETVLKSTMLAVPHNFKLHQEYIFTNHVYKYTLEFMYMGKKCGMGYAVTSEFLKSCEHSDVKYLLSKVFIEYFNKHFSDVHQSVKTHFINCVQNVLNGTDSIQTVHHVSNDNFNDIGNIANRSLPAMDASIQVPCECSHYANYKATLFTAVQHLNDKHRWTREAIADWIDRLHDAGIINAEFQPWDEDATGEDSPVSDPAVGQPFTDKELMKALEILDNPCASMVPLDTIEGTTISAQYLDEIKGWKNVGYTTEGLEIKYDED